MILKMLKIVFSFLLISGDCWAAGSPFEYSDAMKENLAMLRQGSRWLEYVEAERNLLIVPGNGFKMINYKFDLRVLERDLFASATAGDVTTLADILSTELIHADHRKRDEDAFWGDSPDCDCCPLQCAYEGYRCTQADRHFLCMRVLLDCGASPHIKWPVNKPIIFDAIQRGYIEIVEMLLEKDADIAQVNEQGRSIFDWVDECVRNKRDDKKVVKRIRKIEKYLKEHFVLLLLASIVNDDEAEFIRLWNILARNVCGELAYACAWCNDEGRSLRYLARQFDRKKIVSILRSFGA
ncbi:hypothetical protein IPF37_05185 [bacterium]|nr:MAG: hypothetical protein IPF37_05185 [bacterium]